MILTRGQRAVEAWKGGLGQQPDAQKPLRVCYIRAGDDPTIECHWCGKPLGTGHGATLEKGKIGRG